jgi:short-subunit dehydrogenase
MKNVVVITGASSGIGAAAALALAASHRLVLIARRAERLTELVARIKQSGGDAMFIAADLASSETFTGLIADIVGKVGRIDVLVNNAGMFEMAKADDVSIAHVRKLWQLNVQAPMLLTAAALPQLRANKGMIVNVSSAAADASFTSCSVYSATKSALETWSRILREELRADGVRVGVIAPGATATGVWPRDVDIDRGRMCKAEDIGEAVRAMITVAGSASIDRLVITPPRGPL